MTEWILSSSILIFVVIGLRTVFKGKISLRLQYAIWGLVLLRLLIPVSFGSSHMSVANLTVSDAPPVVQSTVSPNTQIPEQVPNHVPDEIGQEIKEHHASQEIEAEVPAEASVNIKALLRKAAPFVWALGFVSVAGLFLFTNARFKRKVTESRYGLDIRKNNLDVYATGEIDTPCLFGIRHPAIYVTYPVADDPTLLRHTLEHEATHYRHGDHIWAVLRCVCLAIHWYNPLVWWAAYLSQRDAELACDEATIRRLGEGERVEYGRTLIGMTCRKKANVLITATTMNSGISGLKERIMLIAKKPKMAAYTLLIVILAASIAVGCTFTGPKTESEGAGARGEILDKNGEVIVSKDLPGGATPAESTEATGLVTEPPVTETPDNAPPVNIPEMLREEPEENKICIGVQPTALSTSCHDLYYIIPENQELLLEYFQAAVSRGTELSWDSSVKMAGWYIVYQGQEWQVFEDGSLRGDMSIAGADATELVAFCRNAIGEAGLDDPVRPEEIRGIISATLSWNGAYMFTNADLLKGAYTVTDPLVLDRLESLFANSRYYGSARCPFTAHLELKLENGETLLLAMGTDNCSSWMSQGVAYGYGEETNVGIEGNEEFYSFFLTSIIHEKAQEGPEALAEFWPYVNWGLYSRTYSIDDTFALMDMFRDYVVDNPSDWMVCVALSTPRGLDGAFAQYYAGVVGEIFEADPAAFNFACRQMVPEQQVKDAVNFLAFYWNITPEEAREKLDAAKAP